MIRTLGISSALIVAASVATAREPVCPPIGLYFEQDDAQQVLRIVPGCLGDAEELGVAMAKISRIVLDALVAQDPNQSYVAVEEVLVEAYVSEILEPTVAAPAN